MQGGVRGSCPAAGAKSINRVASGEWTRGRVKSPGRGCYRGLPPPVTPGGAASSLPGASCGERRRFLPRGPGPGGVSAPGSCPVGRSGGSTLPSVGGRGPSAPAAVGPVKERAAGRCLPPQPQREAFSPARCGRCASVSWEGGVGLPAGSSQPGAPSAGPGSGGAGRFPGPAAAG